jgi:ferredoxin-type protein NapH
MIRLQSGKANCAHLQRVSQLRNIIQVAVLALLVAGFYSPIRPVLMVLLPLSFLAGNFFCGWICPFGTAQEIFGKLGSLTWKKKIKMPFQIQRYVQYSRYLLAVALVLLASEEFAKAVPFNAYKSFMAVAGGRTVETASIVIVGVFLFIALFFERPFCNYVCSEGIKYGLASLTRAFTIKRDLGTCVNCKRCDEVCPMNIQVSNGRNVRNAQCINCFRCIGACPGNKTLFYGTTNFTDKLIGKFRSKRG